MSDECLVCYQGTTDTLLPCAHVVCQRCALEWLRRTPTCPACRADVAGVDPIPLVPSAPCRIVQLVTSSARPHLGITVTDDARGVVGVRVSKVAHGDVAHSAGLRAGDVITHVNGIHVTSHSDAIRIFNCAKAHGVPMRLCVHVGKAGWWSSWWNACLPKDETRVVGAIVPYF